MAVLYVCYERESCLLPFKTYSVLVLWDHKLLIITLCSACEFSHIAEKMSPFPGSLEKSICRWIFTQCVCLVLLFVQDWNYTFSFFKEYFM